MEESTAELERSVAAPMIFIIVLALQFLSRYFEINKKVIFSSFPMLIFGYVNSPLIRYEFHRCFNINFDLAK